MKNEMFVAGIQAPLVWENPTENKLYFEKKINLLPENLDLLVLPEMFTTGFTMNPEKVAEKMDGQTISWLQKIASEKNFAITGSLVIEENEKYYNRLIFVHPCGKVDFYNKRHLFALAGEDKVYVVGMKNSIILYQGWRICALICYDLRFPVWSRNTENYDLLIFMANWPITRINAWDTLLKARAIENISYTIGVNRIGVDENQYQYCGNSLIVDYLGAEISKLEKNQEGIISSKINKKEQEITREKLGFLKDKDSFSIKY